MRAIPYLNFDGDCAEAFRFYARVLGAPEPRIQTHGDSPMAGQLPPEHHHRVLHAYLHAGELVLMASDSPPGQHAAPRGVWVSLLVDDVAEAERIYAALSEGAQIVMPLAPTFWTERFAMLTDRFGTPWMISGGAVPA